MARQVLPIVGAIAGGLIAGPTGAQVGFALGSLIGNAVDPLEVQGNRVGDNPLQTASEGGARAIVFGKGCIRATCILERGNRIVRKQREQSGKGGGPVTINERVFWTFAIGLGEDLIGGAILRIWEGEKLVYDVTPGSAIPEESAEFAQKFRFYDGSETQLPDPDLETIHGVGEAPYYRGTAYVVFPNFDLTDYREAIPVYRWEVAAAAELEGSSFLIHAYGEVRRSSDGNNWSAWQDSPVTGHFASGMKDSFLVYGVSSTFYTSPDASLSFSASSGASSSPSADYQDSQSSIDGVSAAIAGGVSASRYSGDVGASFATAGTPATSLSSIVPMGMGWLGMQSYRLYTGPQTPSSWTETYPASIGYEFNCIWSDGNVARIGGSDTVLGEPRLWRTADGVMLDLETLPAFSSATEITAISRNPGNGQWMIGTDSGELAWMDENGWNLSGTVCGWPVRSIASNGVQWVVAAQESAISNNGTEVWSGVAPNALTLSFSEVRAEGGITVVASTGEVVADVSRIPLYVIVARLHDRCGHSAFDYDVAELTDMLSGVVFEQSITGAEAINSIIGPYFADPSEYDGQIHYIKRGDPVVRTITYDDLTEEPDETQRQNAIEYPRKLHFFFQASTTAYAATKATSSRSSPDLNTVKGEVSVASPITFDGPDEPAQIAAKLHKVNWTDAEGELEWEVTDEQLDLVPTDCVGLSLRGRVTRARITHIEDTPGRRKLTMRVDRQSAYTSDVTGIPLPTPTPPQPSILSPTVNAYMDIPALLDSHDLASPVYYDGMSGQTDVWPGAVLQRSLDTGSTWNNVTATTLNAIMGVLQETVPDASPYYTDTTNRVVVRLYMDDEIESISNQAFLSEQGAFALSWEDSGQTRWEIMQYRDAQQDSNGDWILTTLHRGRLNSEAVEHPHGSAFVLLDTAVRLVTAQSAWINTDLTHRAVTNGLGPESATVQTDTYTAQSQTEWPVAHLFLSQDTSGDTTATVVPRHRFGTSLNPIRSINWTGYRWTVTDSSNTISRDGTSETEVFDTSGWGPVTVTVSQLNRITGPGPSVSESIP